MKKILFVINSMIYGGIQKALLNLLVEIKDKYDIKLLLLCKKGAFLEFVPEEVEVLYPNIFWSLLQVSDSEIRKKNRFFWIIRGILVIINRCFGKKILMKLLVKTQKKIGFFDVGISYHQPTSERSSSGGCNEFVLNCCQANKKITFVHCDYTNYGGCCNYNNELYEKFDCIAAVSFGCKESFLSVLPKNSNKTFCVYNCHNYDEIKRLAYSNVIEYKDRIVIVTISRLGAEKGILRALNVFKRLKYENSNFNFLWLIIGDGEEREIIKKEIDILGLKNEVILEGATTNPYRYLPNSDLFLLPSIHEAAPMVINEALFLGIPVICTKTSSTEEMINDKVGFICENSEEGIYTVLCKIRDFPDSIKIRKDYLKNKIFNNNEAVIQFEQLLEWR